MQRGTAIRRLHRAAHSIRLATYCPKTLEEKIEVLRDRVLGWQLDVAVDVIERDEHAGFAALHIVTRYFEVIAMYMRGPGKMGSGKYFAEGARAVFPELEDEDDKPVRWFTGSLYRHLTCGLYHQGITRAEILLSGKIAEAYRFNDLGAGKHVIIISPRPLTQHLRTHFERYVEELRDPRNTKLRSSFEEMYDSELPDEKSFGRSRYLTSSGYSSCQAESSLRQVDDSIG